MAQTKYQTDIELISAWSDLVDHHWHRLRGQLHNDKQFWADCLHDIPTDLWWSWVDVYPSLAVQHREFLERFPKLKEDTGWIKAKLMLDKPVTKKNLSQYNITAFRTLMTIHDLVNEIRGTPTQQYSQSKQPEALADTPYARLFS